MPIGRDGSGISVGFRARVTTGTVGGMFEYFTGPKYVWNLGVCATLNNGGAIDEVDRACRPAREAPDVNSGSKIFMQSWKAVADQVADQARASEAAGHLRTAGQQWYRSGLYVCQAERMLSNSDPGRREFYQQALDAFAKVFEIADPATTPRRDPVRGHHAAGVLLQREQGRRAGAVRGHVERPRLHQGAHVHLRLGAGDARARASRC